MSDREGGDAPSPVPDDYPVLLAHLKAEVRAAQQRAVLAVNRELVLLYWEIGRSILAAQDREGWGAKVIDRLAADLRREFPEMKGFSPRNLKYMRRFAEVFSDATIVQQAAAQIPWFHTCLILDKVKDPAAREFYIRTTVEHGWSRNILALQIEGRLFEREGRAVMNFPATLPPVQSDLARATLKDPYLFDFLAFGQDAVERDLERGLLDHLRAFLLELGAGFAFVGSQYHLEVAGEDFFIDLLFYHLRLRCFVVIDLKMGPFRPEYAGKMSFYLSAVDDLLRGPRRPSVDRPGPLPDAEPGDRRVHAAGCTETDGNRDLHARRRPARGAPGRTADARGDRGAAAGLVLLVF